MSNFEEVCDVLEDLCNLCRSDDLSLPTLQEELNKLDQLRPFPEDYEDWCLSSRPFFHYLCLSKNITMDMVEYVLDKFPEVAGISSEDEAEYDGFIYTNHTYPLHMACYNPYCSHAIIELIMKQYPPAISDYTYGGWPVLACGDWDDEVEGVPLHYYVIRRTNTSIVTMKMLIDAYPQAMLAIEREARFTPLHAIVGNEEENMNNLLPTLKFLLETEPLLIQTVNQCGKTPLHIACSNKNITMEVFQFIYNLWPEAIRLEDIAGCFPLHLLCYNERLNDDTSLDMLRFMLSIDPTLVRVRGNGSFPIHEAAGRQSFLFCKLLIDGYPESVRFATESSMLPIHSACINSDYNYRTSTVATIQYMLDLYPGSIDAMDNKGQLPIHKAARVKRADLVEILLKHDPQAASKATACRDGDPNSNYLPLHWACGVYKRGDHTEVLRVLFDAYPEAVHSHNGMGKTPFDLAWEAEVEYRHDPKKSNVVNFLLTQRAYAKQARDIKAKTTIDRYDWLSLYCALKDNALLGSIKLLVGALRSIGHTVSLPLNTACEFSSVKVVRYLVELDNIVDEDLASMHLLHSACRGRNLEVIKYFLDEHISLVSSAEANENGELPIHLLCKAGKDMVDIESTEYIEIIWRILLANPEAVAGA